MKKRILSALLTLGMVLTMLPVSVFATEPGDGSGTTSYGADLSGVTVGVPEAETVGAPEGTESAVLEAGVNIIMMKEQDKATISKMIANKSKK